MKKILICLLVAILPLSALSLFGCGRKPENVETEKSIMLRDFEEYNPDFMTFQMSQNFGVIEVNTDERYVSSGKQSAKLRPFGGYYYLDPPTVKIPFYSTLLGYNYKELTEFSAVFMKVYNAETFDITVYCNFEFFDGQSSPRKPYILKNGWNEIEIKIEHDILNMFYDLGDCNGLVLGFDDFSLDGREFDDAPTLYLDEIKLKMTTGKYIAPEIDISLDKYEICGFEKAYQQYILKASSENGKMPELTVVSAENGISPRQGNKMLKVEFSKGSGGYARVAFSPKLFEKIDFGQFKDNADEYAIAYDVYNATSRNESVATYYIWGGIKEWPNTHLAWGVNMEANNTQIPKNSWITYKLSLADVYSWDKRTLEEGFNMFMMFDDGIAAGESVYFDNFRIEKL